MNFNGLQVAVLKTLAIGLGLAFFSSHSTAQTQYVKICQEQVAATEPDSSARLKASLKLTDALYSYDLTKALEQSKSALALAKQLGDVDAESVCYMDQALIRGWLEGRDIGKDYFEKACETFNDAAPSEYQCHYYSSAILYKVFRNSRKFDLTNYFERHAKTGRDCADPYLSIYQHINFVFIRVLLEKSDPAEPAVVASKRKILDLNQSLQLSDADAILALLDAAEAKLDSRPSDYVIHLQESLRHYQKSGDRLGMIAINGLLARPLIEAEKWDKCLDVYDHCLELANAHGAQPLVMECYAKLAFFNMNKGLLRQAKKMLTTGMALEYYRRRNSPFRHPIYELAFEIACIEQDIPNITKYGQLLASQQENSFRGQHDNLITQISELKIDNHEIQQRFSSQTKAMEDKFKLEQTNAQARIQLMYVVAIILAIPILATALLVCFKRLRFVSRLLTKEQEHSREGDEIRKGLETKLKQLERTESLGLLAGGIAHDFNNILVGVLGNAEIMKESCDDYGQFLNDRIDQIIISAEKAADLSHQLLAYTGKHQIERQTVDLNQIVQQLAPLIRANKSRGIELDISYVDQTLACEIDKTQIEQVILNLVNNALAATDNAGKLIIRTGVEIIDEVDDALLGTRAHGGVFNFVEVQDFGCGIEKSKLKRIFDPFYTGTKSGRGLGLAVVYGMVVGHDGLIGLNSTLKQGSTFRILIPQADKSILTTEDIDSSRYVSDVKREKRTIVVVDDQLPVLEFAEQALKSLGWNVIVASCGQDMLDILEDHMDQVGCLLMDVLMPVMGASELLAELHNRSICLPVILMSGYSQNRLSDMTNDPMVTNVLEKPFRINELENAIREAIATPLEMQEVGQTAN